MASESEPAKLLLPYLQRADELQKHEPLVAYYCRLYAMEQGLKIPQSDRTKTTNALLVSLMNQLEKDKKSIKLGPDDHLHVEGFALNVFSKADKQDRGGRADLNTAKTFYAASIFFEILNQFGELQPELEQKQKYAVWKAADIRKALKEGWKPVPGPPGGEDDLSVPSSTSSGEYDLQPRSNNFPDSATRTDLNRTDSAARTTLGSDSPPQQYDHDNLQQSTNFSRLPSNITPPHSSPPANYPTDSYTQVDSSARTAPHPDSSPQIYDHDNIHHSSSFSQSPSNDTPPPSSSIHSSHYPTENYPSESIPQPPSGNNSEHSIYHHSYHHQPYQSEPQPHFHQQFPTQDTPPYSYPNFQSYPSFTESTLPAAPSHYPSYYQGSDASYSGLSPSNAAPYASTPQYNSSGRNGNVPEASPPATEKYEYDSSYQPPPEKIAEAHKAARFAVGALAFDDVSTAVDHLKKSLELLTNPSAAQ